MPFQPTSLQLDILRGLRTLEFDGCASADAHGKTTHPRIQFACGIPRVLLAMWVEWSDDDFDKALSELERRGCLRVVQHKVWPLDRRVIGNPMRLMRPDQRLILLHVAINKTGVHFDSAVGVLDGTRLRNARRRASFSAAGAHKFYFIAAAGLDALDAASDEETESPSGRPKGIGAPQDKLRGVVDETVQTKIGSITVSNSQQTIQLDGHLIRFGGVETWKALWALWVNRPNAVDIGDRAGRSAADVAKDLRRALRQGKAKSLAAVIKAQRGVGYYLELPID